MRAGVEVFLDACAEPELQRIALHDAPAVLGWDRWREIAAAQRPRPDRGEPAGRDRGRGDRARCRCGRWPTCCWAPSTRRRCWSPAPRTPSSAGRGRPTVLLALLDELRRPATRLGAARAPAASSSDRARRRGRAGATPSARTCARRRAAAPRAGSRPRPGSSPRPRTALTLEAAPARGQRFGGRARRPRSKRSSAQVEQDAELVAADPVGGAVVADRRCAARRRAGSAARRRPGGRRCRCSA